MKNVINYTRTMGIETKEHKSMCAVEFRKNDKSVWYDMYQVKNSFTKKNLQEIAEMLA